ncbi:hypothetical protein K2Y11_22720 [bacterium]|nr:hypothetical protein [bacterium]
MNGEEVRLLEEEIEKAISRIFDRPSLRRHRDLASSRLIHLMAKAAVTVYEGAELASELPDHSEE